ncbi:MAG: hypothetical protein M0P91_05165 [Sulfuricurvum sp.]|uniref:hypothetical protein n=1 Tax=Sulfuricurvum sp. TaxID=2025608 RepID=UPI0025E08EE9|nr:hypothetical protein [Sulfuricurvum sp.]MCK9372565.1 hypothetical protein [Sulfuricurvum sp.]
MKKIHITIVLDSLFLFSGCFGHHPVHEPDPLPVITKKCDTKKPKCQELVPETGDNVEWLKARLENYPKLQSCLYDFEAALEKCI